MLANIFASNAPMPMKSPLARPMRMDRSTGYQVKTQVFSPSHIGVPASRPRKYSLMQLCSTMSSLADSVNFGDMFFRELAADASIYLVAPEHEKLAESKEVIQKVDAATTPRRVVHLATGEPSAEKLLCSGDYGRLEGYRFETF